MQYIASKLWMTLCKQISIISCKPVRICIGLFFYTSSLWVIIYGACVVLLQKETEKLRKEFEKARQTFEAKIASHEKTNSTQQVLCGSPFVNAKCVCWSVVLNSECSQIGCQMIVHNDNNGQRVTSHVQCVSTPFLHEHQSCKVIMCHGIIGPPRSGWPKYVSNIRSPDQMQ